MIKPYSHIYIMHDYLYETTSIKYGEERRGEVSTMFTKEERDTDLVLGLAPGPGKEMQESELSKELTRLVCCSMSSVSWATCKYGPSPWLQKLRGSFFPARHSRFLAIMQSIVTLVVMEPICLRETASASSEIIFLGRVKI